MYMYILSIYDVFQFNSVTNFTLNLKHLAEKIAGEKLLKQWFFLENKVIFTDFIFQRGFLEQR